MTISEYEDHFSQLSHYVLHMVSTDALRAEIFIKGLANLMFTTLSRITYAEVVDAVLRIKAS